MFVHVGIRLQRTNTGEFHSPSTHNLAEFVGGINSLAVIRDHWVRVKEFKFIEISWGEFNSVDWHITKESSGLVHSNDERAANIADTINVNPTVLFGGSIKFRKSQASLVSFDSELSNSQILGSESHVQSITENLLSGKRIDVVNEGEGSDQEIGGQEGGERVVGGINVSEKEVVIAVGGTFELLEGLVSSISIEFSGEFLSKREPGGLETSIVSPFNPFLVRVHLDVFSGPVPGSLGFNDVGNTVNLEDHDTVTDMRASTPFNDLIKTVESSDGDEITRAKEGFIKFNNDILRSFLPLETGGFIDEFNVGSDLSVSGLATEERNVGVKAETSEEKGEGLE